MKYRYLGRSGLLVSRLCLGTMTFGNPDWGCDQATSSAIVRRFVEAGGTFIDTANSYSAGESEKMLGVALKDFSRDELVIATDFDREGANAAFRKAIELEPERLEFLMMLIEGLERTRSGDEGGHIDRLLRSEHVAQDLDE